jgi:predicted HTH domain antitoxin
LYAMTEVLSVKVDKEKLRQLEEIAREEQTDRSTTAGRLLDMGMKEWKVNKAVEMFGRGKLSLWRGAATAGVSLREFTEILDERRVAWVGVSGRDIEAEVKAIERETR